MHIYANTLYNIQKKIHQMLEKRDALLSVEVAKKITEDQGVLEYDILELKKAFAKSRLKALGAPEYIEVETQEEVNIVEYISDKYFLKFNKIKNAPEEIQKIKGLMHDIVNKCVLLECGIGMVQSERSLSQQEAYFNDIFLSLKNTKPFSVTEIESGITNAKTVYDVASVFEKADESMELVLDPGYTINQRLYAMMQIIGYDKNTGHVDEDAEKIFKQDSIGGIENCYKQAIKTIKGVDEIINEDNQIKSAESTIENFALKYYNWEELPGSGSQRVFKDNMIGKQDENNGDRLRTTDKATIVVDIKEEVEVQVGPFKRILENMYTNACKYYMPKGPVRPDHLPNNLIMKITIKQGQRGPIMTIEDNGPGIAPKTVAAILGKETPGKSVTVEGIKGTGVGLHDSVMPIIREVLGGEMDITESQELGGACFLITMDPEKVKAKK